MVDRQSSNRQPQKTNPRLDPDTKRPLSDRDRGGWLLPALIIGIMVAGVAIFAFGNHMPTATSPAPDTATGQSSRCASDRTIAGTKFELVPAKRAWGKLTISICYDCRDRPAPSVTAVTAFCDCHCGARQSAGYFRNARGWGFS